MIRLTLAYHALSVAMLVGSAMARAWLRIRWGRVMDCGGVKPFIPHIRRILHRIACTWMQCDEVQP